LAFASNVLLAAVVVVVVVDGCVKRSTAALVRSATSLAVSLVAVHASAA